MREKQGTSYKLLYILYSILLLLLLSKDDYFNYCIKNCVLWQERKIILFCVQFYVEGEIIVVEE